jgi:septal ring factor EnvC (AmiA/AmiB activator)
MTREDSIKALRDRIEETEVAIEGHTGGIAALEKALRELNEKKSALEKAEKDSGKLPRKDRVAKKKELLADLEKLIGDEKAGKVGDILIYEGALNQARVQLRATEAELSRLEGALSALEAGQSPELSSPGMEP